MSIMLSVAPGSMDAKSTVGASMVFVTNTKLLAEAMNEYDCIVVINVTARMKLNVRGLSHVVIELLIRMMGRCDTCRCLRNMSPDHPHPILKLTKSTARGDSCIVTNEWFQELRVSQNHKIH